VASERERRRERETQRERETERERRVSVVVCLHVCASVCFPSRVCSWIPPH